MNGETSANSQHKVPRAAKNDTRLHSSAVSFNSYKGNLHLLESHPSEASKLVTSPRYLVSIPAPSEKPIPYIGASGNMFPM